MAQSQETPSSIKKAVERTLEVIKKHKVNTPVALIQYLSILLWSLGCSIDKIPGDEATKTKLRELYLTKPTLGNALANLALDLNEEWLQAAIELQGEKTDQN